MERKIKLPECIYCGDDSQEMSRDHVVPVSYSSIKRNYEVGDMVPCCLECNSILGSVMLCAVEERAAFLLDKYLHKYKSVLRTPRWTDSELAELGHNMKSKVIANIHMKEYISNRLRHLSAISSTIYDESHLLAEQEKPDSKITAYKVIVDFMYSDETKIKFVEKASMRHSMERSDVVKIIEDRSHFDVVATFKYERGYPLDSKLKDIKRAIKRGGL